MLACSLARWCGFVSECDTEMARAVSAIHRQVICWRYLIWYDEQEQAYKRPSSFLPSCRCHARMPYGQAHCLPIALTCVGVLAYGCCCVAVLALVYATHLINASALESSILQVSDIAAK